MRIYRVTFILIALAIACFGSSASAAKASAAKPLEGKIIGLDPGHQTKKNDKLEPVAPGSSTMKKSVSSGTRGVDSKTWEHEINLTVALKLKKLLEDAGATVIMTRETADVDVPNSERALMMNKAKANLVLRIHCDGNNNPKTHGTSMLVPSGKYCTGIEKASLAAGKAILKSFIDATGSQDRGVRKRSDQTGFNWSTVPICNIEMGFLTNPDEDRKLNSDDYQNTAAQALRDGIVACFVK